LIFDPDGFLLIASSQLPDSISHFIIKMVFRMERGKESDGRYESTIETTPQGATLFLFCHFLWLSEISYRFD